MQHLFEKEVVDIMNIQKFLLVRQLRIYAQIQ